MIEHEQLQYQIRRGVAVTLSVQFYDDGVATDPGVVTVGIVDEAGTEIVASGTATDGSGASPRTYDLAAQSNLNLLIVTWTSSTHGAFMSRVEVVGEHLFSLREARTFDGSVLANTSDYPSAGIEEARARITDDFAHAMSVSHIPRYRRVELFGSDSRVLFVPDLYITDVRSIEERAYGQTDWTAFTQDQMDAVYGGQSGILVRESGSVWKSGYQYRVVYEHGYATPPLPVKRAALLLLTSYMGVSQSSWDPRQTSMRTADGGVISIATPGRAGSTFGFPEVDRVIHDYDESVPVVG